jgi:hypothetical protein
VEHAKQLALGVWRQLANLVEEDCALVRLLKAPDPTRLGSGEAPRSWPKSSLSSNVSGIAAQLTATKGLPAQWLCW